MAASKIRSVSWFRDYFINAGLGNEGINSLPDGIEFEVTDSGQINVYHKIDDDNRELVGAMSKDGSFFPKSISTGPSSVTIGDKHSVTSAGEQVGFLNLQTKVFWFPAIWQGLSKDGNIDSVERRHGALEFIDIANPNPSGGDTDFNVSITSVNGLCVLGLNLIAKAYTGKLTINLKHDSYLVGSTDITDPVTFVEGVPLDILFKTPIWTNPNQLLNIEVLKDDGTPLQVTTQPGDVTLTSNYFGCYYQDVPLFRPLQTYPLSNGNLIDKDGIFILAYGGTSTEISYRMDWGKLTDVEVVLSYHARANGIVRYPETPNSTGLSNERSHRIQYKLEKETSSYKRFWVWDFNRNKGSQVTFYK